MKRQPWLLIGLSGDSSRPSLIPSPMGVACRLAPYACHPSSSSLVGMIEFRRRLRIYSRTFASSSGHDTSIQRTANTMI